MLGSLITGFGLAIAPAVLAMAILSIVEVAIPLQPRARLNSIHLPANLALTFIAFITNFAFKLVMLFVLAELQASGLGLLPQFHPGPVAALLTGVVILDLSTYIGHVSMHKVPVLWRFHAIHHSDRALDVTTTIRQHPGESVIRYVFMSAAAMAFGVTPASFAAYRLTASMIGLSEHSNIALPLWLDTALSWVTASPNMHKVHHSRDRHFTDSNYGNILSFWDRLFGTFTPARIGAAIDYGLDGYDDAETQSTLGLLAVPVRPTAAARTAEAAR